MTDSEQPPHTDQPQPLSVDQPPGVVVTESPSPRLFVVNPRHLDLVLGDKGGDLRAAIRFNLWCAVLIILALLPLMLTLKQWRDWQASIRNDVPGTATVLAHRVQIDPETGTTYFVALTFTQPGTEAKPYNITEEQPIAAFLYDQVPNGAKLNAILTRSGGIILTGPELPPYDRIMDEVVGAVGLLALALIIIFIIRAKTLRRRLLRLEGEVLDGQVVLCRPLLDDSERFSIALSYRFVSPQTAYILQGSTFQTRPDLENRSLPTAKTPIKVRYVDDSLFEVL